MRNVTHAPRLPRTATVAMLTGLTLTLPAAADAKVEPLDGGGGPTSDVSAFIIPIEATIVALDGGTSTTSSTESVAITLEADVFFAFDEADLLPAAEERLVDVVEELAEAGVSELAISGHTDSIGTDAYNQDLSERRAASVETFVASRLDGVSYETRGFGAERPVAPNETEDGQDLPEGRALNRRVELRYTP